MQRLVFDTLTAAQARQLGSISTRISAAISPDPLWAPASAPRDAVHLSDSKAKIEIAAAE